MKNTKVKLNHIGELEQKLGFLYLPHSQFEDRDAVYAKGIEKFQSGRVDPAAIELGRKHIPRIQEGYISRASIRRVSDRVGYGLFAEEEIASGAYVGEYVGTVRENDRLYTEPLNHYCYEYPILDSIGRSFVIDATQGNFTRFINHSSEPNLRPAYAFWEGFYHCIFLAIRPIAKGEQFFYDYGKSYWYIREAPETLSSGSALCAAD